MLTARNEEIDKLALLVHFGADDYMTKPFSARELGRPRVQVSLAAWRADRVVEEPPRVIGMLRLSTWGDACWCRTWRSTPPAPEFDLLSTSSPPGRRRPSPAASWWTPPWGPDWVGDEHLVDVHIGHLRRKLAAVADLPFVETMRGVGYRMGPGPVTGPSRPGSLTTRLLISQVAVSVAMALTMIVVAVIAGPPLFDAHMREAGHDSPDVLAHSEEAFNTAGTLALFIGLLIAATGAIVVSVLISRRLRRSLDDLGDAAARISDGDYAQRVEEPDSRELATLADSFNTMAIRLDAIEASRRRLLTDLAHEIRTPLASMEICVESLEDGAIEPGPEAWHILSSQIGRISRLADDLGQVSAAEEGRLNLAPEHVDPNLLADDAVLAARDAYERSIVALQVEPADGAPPVRVDRTRIAQVLANLLSNALRHTPAGGQVVVGVLAERDAVSIQVRDTGDGSRPSTCPTSSNASTAPTPPATATAAERVSAWRSAGPSSAPTAGS
ncbi:MAG: HAMP domain-containing protein [Propionicimonas sp.]